LVNQPGSEITFLFTDIEGSTKLAQQFPDSLPASLEIHHAILKEAIESCRGFVFEIIGDAFCASFENTIDAVNACYMAQKKLSIEQWKDVVIKVRMGIHRGNAEWNGRRYMGYITLARTQRVMSAAYGGQVLLSEDAYNQLTEKENSEITFRDLGERKLKDLIQPVKIYQLISKEFPSDFPPLITLDARPNNLPVQLTSFIGRKNEIEKVKELLKNTHLLTLTGPGGAGKTRLSLQVGADVIDDFANGVWFVELAPIIDAVLLPQEISKELGIKEETKKTLEETLTSYLKDKEILLILDNCEHLIETCAGLTEQLLKACPKLKILATSREPMKCSGEQTHSILSLEIPDPKGEISPEQLVQYESVRLFIERALTVNRNFRVNNENAPALAEICRQLDGIPLAIELAAARIKVLTVEKIYDRLSNRFSLLTGGKRTAMPRQKTLKALIDWSYDLLTEQEKILWSRLSVFNDGWILESAEEICSDDKLKDDEIFDLLSLLVEKSIIIFDDENERYSILETLKHYGEERLNETNESNKIFSRYLFYFMKLSESAEPKLTGAEAQLWLDRLEEEHGNLQSAIEWSLNHEHQEEGMRLAGALGSFWDIRGYFSIGRRLLESMLRNTKGVSKSVIGKALNCTGTLAFNQGEYQQAMKFHEESLALYRELKDKDGIATSIGNMGIVAYEQGDYERARKLCEEHLVYKREIGDKDSIASSLSDLGNIAYDQGDYQQARRFHEESLALRQKIGNKRGIANSLNNLGNLTYIQGDFDQAQKLYEESLILKREVGDKKGISISLHNLGIVTYLKGNYKQSQNFYEESLALVRQIGSKSGIADTLYDLGNIGFKQGDYQQALKLLEESFTLRREIGNKLGMVYCIMGFASIAGVKHYYFSAACLLGFVNAALQSMNTVFESDEQILYEKVINDLHEKLSDEEFAKYWEEGKKMTIEQATELALSPDK
jgi:predicted ATPase/class 3 adenylate cyclase/Tfp pilus assembly protein PilF